MFPNQTAALMHPPHADFIHNYRAELQQHPNANAAGAPPAIGSFVNETKMLGQEVHTRQPGTAPYPKGKVPVFLVGVDANARNKITSLSHGYVVAGNPGKGKKTHPTYFSRSSDEKRGIMNIDKKFVEAAREKKNIKDGAPTFSPEALAALGNVEPRNYTSKEAFFLAYAEQCQKLGRDIPLKTVFAEYRQMVFMATENEMEVWLREPTGPDAEHPEAWNAHGKDKTSAERAAMLDQLSPLKGKLSAEDRAVRKALIEGEPAPKPNLAERDVRTFMDPFGKNSEAKEKFEKTTEDEKLSGNVVEAGTMAIRHIPEADVLSMTEVKRQELLERMFGDEVQNRNGTLLPASLFGHADITEETSIMDIPLDELRAYSETTQNHPSTKSKFAESQVDSRGERTGITNADQLDERTEKFADSKQTYEFAPEEGNEHGINCNTGAKSILTDSGVAESDVKPATPFQVALHGETRSWNPLSRHPEVSAQLPKNGTPQSRLENMQRSADVLNAKLPQFARNHAERVKGMDFKRTMANTTLTVQKAQEGVNYLKAKYGESSADTKAKAEAAAARLVADPRPETLSHIMTEEVIRNAEEGVARLKAQYGEGSASTKADAEAAVQRLMADPDLTIAELLEERQWEGSSDSDYHQ